MPEIGGSDDFSEWLGQNGVFVAYQVRRCIKLLISLPTYCEHFQKSNRSMPRACSITVAQKLIARISENVDSAKRPGQNRIFAAYKLKRCIKRLFSLPTK